MDIFAETKDTAKDTVKFSKNEEILVDLIRKNPTITADEISKKLKINLRNTKKNIAKLKKAGVIQRIGSDKDGHWEAFRQI